MRHARLLDFDNYDLKSCIDETCNCYPGSDSPLCTSFHLMTIASDALLPMTYLIVTPTDYAQENVLVLLNHAFLENANS